MVYGVMKQTLNLKGKAGLRSTDATKIVCGKAQEVIDVLVGSGCPVSSQSL